MEAVILCINTFIIVYRTQSGVVENDQPEILMGDTDAANALKGLFHTVGIKRQMRPQLLMIVLDGKNAEQYFRVKMSADSQNFVWLTNHNSN